MNSRMRGTSSAFSCCFMHVFIVILIIIFNSKYHVDILLFYLILCTAISIITSITDSKLEKNIVSHVIESILFLSYQDYSQFEFSDIKSTEDYSVIYEYELNIIYMFIFLWRTLYQYFTTMIKRRGKIQIFVPILCIFKHILFVIYFYSTNSTVATNKKTHSLLEIIFIYFLIYGIIAPYRC